MLSVFRRGTIVNEKLKLSNVVSSQKYSKILHVFDNISQAHFFFFFFLVTEIVKIAVLQNVINPRIVFRQQQFTVAYRYICTHNYSLFPYIISRLTIYNSGPVALWTIISTKILYITMYSIYSIGTLVFFFALTFNRTRVPFVLKILHQLACYYQ